MYKVLHIMGGACYGGISAVVLNYYHHMDLNKIHFDIAVTEKFIGRDAHAMEDMGCTVFPLCLKSENRRLYESQIKKILAEGNYDAVHVHHNSTSWFTLRIARGAGIKTRIAHAHTAGHLGPDTLLFKIRQLLNQSLNCFYATHLLSCGQKAGEFVFGKIGTRQKKHMVLPNAIDTNAFSYDPILREHMRKELGIDQSFAIGMIGRLAPPKNSIYAISIFKAIKDKIPNAKLLLAGSGEDEEATRAEVLRLKLSNDVLFLGQRNDVKNLYQAIDLYMLPSLFEGFPVATVEAMATGLPCLLSDTITDELKAGTNVHYLPLHNTKSWAEAALKYAEYEQDRSLGQSKVKQMGLDIRDTAELLEKFYLKIKQEQSHKK